MNACHILNIEAEVIPYGQNLMLEEVVINKSITWDFSSDHHGNLSDEAVTFLDLN